VKRLVREGGVSAAVRPADGHYAINQSLEKAIALLEFLLAHPYLGLSDLARLSGINKTTCYRLLRTLAAAGYVAYDRGTGRYSLGLKLFELGTWAIVRLPVRQQALEIMQKLCAATSKSVFLSILLENASVCIEEIHSADAVWLGSQVGTRLPLYATATGKVLLAYAPSFRDQYLQQAPLQPITPRSVVDPAAIRRELDRVVADGWAMNDEETEIGVRYVAAPIRDHTGEVIAALSLGGAVESLPPARLPAMLQRLLSASREISFRLGYTSAPFR
jgi:DNA-binding IclR family transcriptional regulator